MTTPNILISNLSAEIDALKRKNALIVKAARRAESFIAGFEDDDTQEGIPSLLGDLRYAIDEASDAISVKEVEHERA